ncbi:MAG: dihydroneopterin aldolase [Sphingomonadales bacterium]
MDKSRPVGHLKIADADRAIRHVFVRDLELPAHIGVYEHEKGAVQLVRINVDLSVLESSGPLDDSLQNAVCYEQIVDKIRVILQQGHINLAETLAERIADAALEDKRVVSVQVRVEKPDAVREAASVGVEIERRQAGI